jgi:uncharacterized protein YmfQ (DUF2313 family)
MTTYICPDLPGPTPVLGDALSDPSGDALLDPILALTPRGPAWRTDEMADADHNSFLHRFWRAVADPVADLYAKSWNTILEGTTGTIIDSLEDWETEFGLPDTCVVKALSRPQRIAVLRAKVLTAGGQSIPYFVCLARTLGYDIEVREYRAFRTGMSRCGSTAEQISNQNIEFYWQVRTSTKTITWFHTGGPSQTGKNRLGELGHYPDLECLLRKWKPAHTEIVFRYIAA